MDKDPRDAGRRNGVQPIIQSYGMTPSFVGAKKLTGTRGGRGQGQVQIGRGLGPRHKPMYPKKYPQTGSGSSGGVFIRSPSKPPSYHPAFYPALSSSVNRHPKSNSKVWKKPSSALSSLSQNSTSSSSPPVLGESNSTAEVRPDLLKFTKVRSETVTNLIQIPPVLTPAAPVPTPSMWPKISPQITYTKSPVNSTIPVGSKSRFKLIKSGAPILNNGESATFFNPNKYKLDRRANLKQTSPWKGKQLEIARRTIIGGMNLYQRRSNLNSSLVPHAYAVTARPRLSSSFRSTFSLKNRPAANKSFSVRPYSLRRIRKSSLRTRPDGPFKSPIYSKKSYSFTKRESITDAEIPKLELSSLSISQSPSILLATRCLQRSRQTLYTSMRKKNTFCIFYNRFGICKRKDEGKCSFVHDPRQLNICSKTLNHEECKKEECKLSHDLQEGKVPPCRFYLKGKCSKTAEECPYLHPPSLLKRVIKNKQGLSPALQSKLMLKGDKKGSKQVEKVEEKSRYFETRPNSQPIIAIVPRRYPKDLVGSPTTTTRSKTETDKEMDSNKSQISTGNSGPISDGTGSGGSSSESSLSTEAVTSVAPSCDNGNDQRRQRLLSRVKGLNSQALSSKNKKTNGAPLFLAFSTKK